MSDPTRLRDSTQIVLPAEAVESLEPQLTEEFTITVFPEGENYCRIIGSPVEIKAVGEFLARRGVSVP
ncbi:uncharacterized protein Nmag_1180 [Natrialba magadii ATCC 43099]|uniref:Uncharacterized protein n=1 Tax=Natrialba magadii (strain ATCC 43099 / DSM 3394 / CCM 3739 / CIP 104546 / IAM 13178 / JCM 8861 / NBRC 102185 / NCIMB 2190 / MS3) TaxID=547559 RepID=D3SS38_NATMM|nr:hypothetical protein [Natrialba magadii]ADD04764.1 uncharacterized protein Nmag_1180 [Natrialba magadii ATCC 43099]ELY24931.1 hypothetical protein C500_18423 [Natrialba magadii ATCC 43099]